MFPDLKKIHQPFFEIDLDEVARQFRRMNKVKTHENPLLNPSVCQRMIDEIHSRRRAYSWGDYLSDRSTLWMHSEYAQSGKTLHLGIDGNVPAGTAVALDQPAIVERVDLTHPPGEEDWGPRIIFKLTNSDDYLLYCHLKAESITAQPGDRFEPDEPFATVASWPENGKWFEHVHVQDIAGKWYRILKRNPGSMDGYGKPEQRIVLAERFPNPFDFVSIP